MAVAFLTVFFLLAMPVGAQETTAVADQAQQTMGTTAQSPNILSLTLAETIGIVMGIVALFVAFGKILWDANQNPGGPSIDARLTEQVNTAHNDREWIERLERAYALGGMQSTRAVDALAGVLSNIAPLTGLKLDDAVLKLLRDVQKPGEEDAEGPPLYEAQTPG